MEKKKVNKTTRENRHLFIFVRVNITNLELLKKKNGHQYLGIKVSSKITTIAFQGVVQ